MDVLRPCQRGPSEVSRGLTWSTPFAWAYAVLATQPIYDATDNHVGYNTVGAPSEVPKQRGNTARARSGVTTSREGNINSLEGMRGRIASVDAIRAQTWHISP